MSAANTSVPPRLLARLRGVGPCHKTQLGVLATCPRHRWTLGLSVTVEDGLTSVVCWDGCTDDEIIDALGQTETRR